jgi:exopolysaccharide biosynthesis polyprenyl glycosylphosphotransferase
MDLRNDKTGGERGDRVEAPDLDAAAFGDGLSGPEPAAVSFAVPEGGAVSELLPGARPAGVDEGLGSRLLDRLAGEARATKPREWLLSRGLALADTVALLGAFFVSQLLAGPTTAAAQSDVRKEYGLFLVMLPFLLYAAKLYGLYTRDAERADHSTLDDIVPVLHLVTLGTWVFFGATWLLRIADPRFAEFAVFWIAALGLVLVSRAIARALCKRSPLYRQNALIVGAGEVGQFVARKFMQHPEHGIDVVGFVDDQPAERSDDMADLTILGDPENLPAIAESYDVDRIIVAFSNDSHLRTLELVRELRDLRVQIDIVPRLFEVLGPSATLHGVGALPLVGLPPIRLSTASRRLKRAVDLVVSIVALILLAPALAVFALAIRLTSRGPAIFRQTRMGSGEQTFEMFKFRTMSADADSRKSEFAHLNKHAQNGGDPRMFKIPNDPRVTPVGRFLRRYSLDELPQLFNVIVGDMTLVGPRPLILEEDREITEWGRRRLDLKPGMTGPWQVLGRTEIPFEEMVKIDYLYVTNWSMWRDLKLMAQTIPAILRSRSVVY